MVAMATKCCRSTMRLTAGPGPAGDPPAVIESDPAGFVLTAFGRIGAGTVRDDTALANEFLAGFFRI